MGIALLDPDGLIGFGLTLVLPNGAPANFVGRDSPIAIGSDGLPVISHEDDTARALRFTKCATRTCQS